jgi:hypothetical protein
VLPWSMHDFNTSTVVEGHAFDLLHIQHVAVVWRRSLTQALTIVIQTGLDAGAAYGAFSLAGFLGAAESIPLHNIWGFGATFLGSYFGELCHPVHV